jgi:hypothetical protein
LKKLKKIAESSIVVATADLFHHGVCYNTTPENAIPIISREALVFAKEQIDIGLKLLIQVHLS